MDQFKHMVFSKNIVILSQHCLLRTVQWKLCIRKKKVIATASDALIIDELKYSVMEIGVLCKYIMQRENYHA